MILQKTGHQLSWRAYARDERSFVLVIYATMIEEKVKPILSGREARRLYGWEAMRSRSLRRVEGKF